MIKRIYNGCQVAVSSPAHAKQVNARLGWLRSATKSAGNQAARSADAASTITKLAAVTIIGATDKSVAPTLLVAAETMPVAIAIANPPGTTARAQRTGPLLTWSELDRLVRLVVVVVQVVVAVVGLVVGRLDLELVI